MTFKDLQKAAQAEAEHTNAKANIDLINQLQGLPFWIFDQAQHRLEYRRTESNCCFWHVITPPQKDGHDMPLLPYQKTLYDSLQNHYIREKIAWCKKLGLNIADYLQVVPVSFAVEGASMLAHCKNLLEHEANLIAINPKWDKLITALKSCTALEYKMDKDLSSHSDVMDGYRLAMKFFTLNKDLLMIIDMESYETNNDYVAININIKGSSRPSTNYNCNWYNRKLFYNEQDEVTGKQIWWCSFCSIEFILGNQLIKQKSTLKTPGGELDNAGNVIGDSRPLITMGDDPNKDVSSTSYKQQKLSPLFMALEKQGFKITSYEER